MSSLTHPTDLNDPPQRCDPRDLCEVQDLAAVIDVVIGVDTHVHTHAAAVLHAGTGGVLAETTVRATGEGYAELLEFAVQVSGQDSGRAGGGLRAWAIEGTGSYGAGLARFLTARDEPVIELDRPVRVQRRHGAKSDPLDAVRAGREALARTRLGTPRGGGTHAGQRQSLSVLLAARRSAVQAAGDAQRQLFSLIVAAPEPVRERFRGQRPPSMVKTAARMRIRSSWDLETVTTVTTLRSLARRVQRLDTEAGEYEQAIMATVRSWRPDLLDQPGVGPIVAATVLCAWSRPGRIRSESAFAMLAGVAPIPANSGQVTTRYRVNHSGDRQLNRALHTIALCRIRYDDRTRAYVERRTTEGKTPREIKRCLKRYIARDIYRLLERGTPQPA